VAALAMLVAGAAVFLGFQALRGVQRAASAAAALLAAHQLAEARADAERVCAWAVSERETFEKIITRGVVGAAIRNAGHTPVYDLEIVFRDHGPVERDRINEDGTIRLAPSADMHVELRFTDSRGRRWQRDDKGLLTQVGENVARAPAPVEQA
jgi:hypothetical protein